MTKKPAAKQSKPNESTLATPAYKPSAEDKRRQMKYMAEDAVRTLTRADEIRKDKQLMGHVKKHAREQVKTLQKVCK